MMSGNASYSVYTAISEISAAVQDRRRLGFPINY
jgi:hypothetical protein